MKQVLLLILLADNTVFPTDWKGIRGGSGGVALTHVRRGVWIGVHVEIRNFCEFVTFAAVCTKYQHSTS